MKKVLSCPSCKGEMELRVLYCPRCSIEMTGDFKQSPYCGLSPELEAFLLNFVKTQANVKELESIYGVSYPTIKKMIDKLKMALGVYDPVGIDDDTCTDYQSGVLAILDNISISRLGPRKLKKAKNKKKGDKKK